MNQLAAISRATSTSTGITPLSRGCEVFCIGSEAMSLITSVTTSSLGCISLIWRLPISLIAVIMKP